jgi:hypothetical protein
MPDACEDFAIEDGHSAFVAIEEDLLLVECAAGVLHMLYVNLQSRDGSHALADSIWFAAKGIEGAVERIRSRLGQRSEKDGPIGSPAGH